MDQYMSMFLRESAEHLTAMGDCLLALEREPQNLQLVNEIFRSAHTLKGMAATMGFTDISALTHQMENVLDLLRSNQRASTVEVIDLLLQCVSRLEELVAAIEAGGRGSGDVEGLMHQLATWTRMADEAAVSDPRVPDSPSDGLSAFLLPEWTPSLQLAVRESAASGLSAWAVGIQLAADASLKGVRAFMIFRQLGQLGEVIASRPTVEELQEEQFDDRFVVFLLGTETAEAIRTSLLNISDVKQVFVEPLAIPDVSEQPVHAPGTPPVPNQSRTLRVDVQKIDRLMNLMSELAIDRSRLQLLSSQLGDARLTETVDHFQRLLGECQDVVFGLRMVPVDALFNRFPRMVRDLSRDLGKQIQLQMLGMETELDRTIVDEMSELMVHLLRNSIDHGIETKEERLRMNKDETGTLVISAHQSGNQVMIEVTDDGRGIDRERVLQKALEKGWLTSSEANNLSDEEVYGLLMQPGFSTAETVTDISGRGVGLDAVKSKIESLGGNVGITSSKGEGTTFTLQVPLTLSIIQSLLVEIGGEVYALPLNTVVETQKVLREQVIGYHHQRMVRVREKVVPLIHLPAILGLADAADRAEISYVVIQKGQQWAALQVDAFLGDQEVVVKSLGKYLGEVFPLAGATILGDGRVALILDGLSLIHS